MPEIQLKSQMICMFNHLPTDHSSTENAVRSCFPLCRERRQSVQQQSILARIASIAIVLALLAPALFIIAEAHHNCTGDECPICQALACAESLVHETADIPAHTTPAASIYALSALFVAASFRVSTTTLVGLKVRLDC